VSTFLVNAVSFFLNHDKDKKDLGMAFKKHFSEDDYSSIKCDLFQCLLQLPSPSLYASKFVHLLHSVCEEIVRDDIQGATLQHPLVFRKLLHFEDFEAD